MEREYIAIGDIRPCAFVKLLGGIKYDWKGHAYFAVAQVDESSVPANECKCKTLINGHENDCPLKKD